MITTLALRELAGKVDTSFADTGRSLKVSPARQSTHFGAGVGWGAHAGDATTPSHQDESTRSFVVFNPTAWARREVVKVTVWTGYGQWQIGKQHPDRRYRLRRGDGNCEAVQKVDEGYYWGHQYVDFAVPVEVPALGYTSFSIEDVGPEIVGGFGYPQPEAEKSDQDATNSAKFDLGRGGIVPPVYILENEYLQAEIDKTTGGLSRLVDKATGRNLIRPDAAAQLEYLLERPGEMSSWVIYPARQRQCPLTLVSLRDDQQGPSEASTIATFKVNDSTITQTYRLRRGAKQLDMHFDVAWREIGYREKGCPTLRYEVPLAVSEPAGRYETPFGWVDRDVNDGREVPSQRFVDIVGKPDGASGKVGCCLLNDSKYGFSLDDSTLRVSLLRSSYEPDRVPETGDHEFNLALRPHDGKATPADLIQWGASCNHPLQVVGTGIHAGELPAQGNEGVHVTGKQVLLAAIKKAEDDDALIFRLIEATGQAATTTVSLDKALFGTVGDVTAVDLLERTVEDDSLSKSANGFKIKLPPRGIASVKVSFA
jgi:alpha-mannosidase